MEFDIGFNSAFTMIVAQLVKNLPAIWETWVLSLGWEDPLEKGLAPYFQYSGLETSMDYIVHGSQRVITSILRSLLPICSFFLFIIFFYATFFFSIFLEQCWIFISSSLLIWKFYISTLLIFLLLLYIIGYLKIFNTHLVKVRSEDKNYIAQVA